MNNAGYVEKQDYETLLRKRQSLKKLSDMVCLNRLQGALIKKEG